MEDISLLKGFPVCTVKTHMDSGCTPALILTLGTNRVCLSVFAAHATLPPGKENQYASDRKLGGPQVRLGRFEEEIFLILVGILTL